MTQPPNVPPNNDNPPAPPPPPPAPPAKPVVKPVAGKAMFRKRHRLVLWSFILWVAIPLLVATVYIWGISKDQYASTTGFTVRQEDGASAVDFLGNISQLTGGGGGSESDILYEFIQSQEIVQRVDEALDLKGRFHENWTTDPVFSLWADPTVEDLLWFWKRIVRVSFDKSSGLMELRVLSHDPRLSQAIGEQIVIESQEMINLLNHASREDSMRYALNDLDEAFTRVKTAREALMEFRSRTQIVDPAADIQVRMGVLNTLQQQLAEALVSYDLLRANVQGSDPRLLQGEQRIEVIRERIAAERDTMAAPDGIVNDTEDYPALIAEFERLTVDREFAETTYRTALAARDIAQSQAARNSSYLAAYIKPTLAQSAEYPQRVTLTLLTTLFLLLSWAILILIYYSIRDRR